jgi:general stress protein CsbA
MTYEKQELGSGLTDYLQGISKSTGITSEMLPLIIAVITIPIGVLIAMKMKRRKKKK